MPVAKPESPLQKYRKDFKPLNKPGEEPKLPKQISVLSSEKLSDLMLVYTAWREYTEDLISEAMVDFTNQKNKYDFEYSKAFLLSSGKTAKDREMKVDTDLEIHKLYLSLSRAESYYELLTKKQESYTNCLAVISREITRRGNAT